jgi:hypothetical protein
LDLLQQPGEPGEGKLAQHERSRRLEAAQETPRRDRARKAGRTGRRANHLRCDGGDDRERLQANGRRSLNRVEDAIDHLREYFGQDKARGITSDRVTAYVAHRQEEKAASATINGELAALSRMFVLAVRAEGVEQAAHRQATAKQRTEGILRGRPVQRCAEAAAH